jgi:hypothetical protein
MSDAFEDRGNAFENRFVLDETQNFRAIARRNKRVALWVAEMKGLTPEAAETYAENFVAAQVGHSDNDVVGALLADVKGANVDLSDHRLRKKMSDEFSEAIEEIKAGK